MKLCTTKTYYVAKEIHGIFYCRIPGGATTRVEDKLITFDAFTIYLVDNKLILLPMRYEEGIYKHVDGVSNGFYNFNINPGKSIEEVLSVYGLEYRHKPKGKGE